LAKVRQFYPTEQVRPVRGFDQFVGSWVRPFVRFDAHCVIFRVLAIAPMLRKLDWLSALGSTYSTFVPVLTLLL
jgi:hypothetical protein